MKVVKSAGKGELGRREQNFFDILVLTVFIDNVLLLFKDVVSRQGQRMY